MIPEEVLNRWNALEAPRAEKKKVMFMAIASLIGALGTCDRKQVGAVIVRDGRCISWGYNGAPPGMPHCHDKGRYHHLTFSDLADWDRTFERWATEEARLRVEKEGCRNATHAEANAIAAAAKQGISTDEAGLYVTVSPCEVCARLIIAAGIVVVYYLEAYRKDDGCQILQKASIPTVQLPSTSSSDS
jgi:dCMP deaminase